jgi:hypothetical protein
MIVADIFQRAVPWTRLLRRERQAPNDLNLRISQRVSAVCACLSAAAALGSIWNLAFLAPAIAGIAAMTGMNWGFYRFLAGVHSWPWALGCIPLHVVFYLCSVTGLGIGFIKQAPKESAASKLEERGA